MACVRNYELEQVIRISPQFPAIVVVCRTADQTIDIAPIKFWLINYNSFLKISQNILFVGLQLN